MDLSALIFVALAVAWAVYLIPKALKHHDDVVRSRSVDRFSHTMRVLARREPVNRRDARLVVTPGRAASAPVVTTKRAQPEPRSGRRSRPAARPTRRATRRRRRVLGLILLANVVAGVGVAALGVHRLVVRRHPGRPARRLAGRLPADGPPRAGADPSARRAGRHEERPATTPPAVERRGPRPPSTTSTTPTPARSPAVTDPSLWDPMPVTLPTYVAKPAAARRTVRTIDLDATGVWTSGRTEADAQIAREADEAAARASGDAGRRATAPSAPDSCTRFRRRPRAGC